MAELGNDGEKLKKVFNALSFERKLVELVEELRLRRNLEAESESTLKSLMDEKYNGELCWEEQQRTHIREKEDLEQQIDLLKRKLEDKVCVADDDKVKQQVMNRTYSDELRMLKEELRSSKSEKLNLQKTIQELEWKLSLHNNFQESIVSQISEVRKTIKTILEDGQQLSTAQKNVMENVAAAKASFRKFDLCNQHLQQSMKIVGKKSEALKKELISSRCELTLLKNSMPAERKKPNHDGEIEKLRRKVMDLEHLLQLSRTENEKTLSNFVQSNELLCKFMDKYSENQERERRLFRDVERTREELATTKQKLQESMEEMRKKEELEALMQRERIANQRIAEIQTDAVSDACLSCDSKHSDVITASSSSAQMDFVEEMRNDLMCLQQNSAVRPRHDFENGVREFALDSKSSLLLSSDKKITISEVLKRKIEVTEFGIESDFVSMMKKKLKEDAFCKMFNTDVVAADEHGSRALLSTSSDSQQQLCVDLAESMDSTSNTLVHLMHLPVEKGNVNTALDIVVHERSIPKVMPSTYSNSREPMAVSLKENRESTSSTLLFHEKHPPVKNGSLSTSLDMGDIHDRSIPKAMPSTYSNAKEPMAVNLKENRESTSSTLLFHKKHPPVKNGSLSTSLHTGVIHEWSIPKEMPSTYSNAREPMGVNMKENRESTSNTLFFHEKHPPLKSATLDIGVVNNQSIPKAMPSTYSNAKEPMGVNMKENRESTSSTLLFHEKHPPLKSATLDIGVVNNRSIPKAMASNFSDAQQQKSVVSTGNGESTIDISVDEKYLAMKNGNFYGSFGTKDTRKANENWNSSKAMPSTDAQQPVCIDLTGNGELTLDTSVDQNYMSLKKGPTEDSICLVFDLDAVGEKNGNGVDCDLPQNLPGNGELTSNIAVDQNDLSVNSAENLCSIV